MSAAVLTILGDASGVKRALGETVAETRRSVAAINAESRKASAKERQELSSDAAMKRQLQRQEYQDKVRAITDQRRVEEAARKAREKALRDEVKSSEKAEKAKVKAAEKTSSALAKLAKKDAKDAEKAEQAKVKATEKAEKERTRLAEAEAKQRTRDANRTRAQEEREEIASTRRTLRGQYRERRRAEQEERERRTRGRRGAQQFTAGAPSAVAGAALAGVAAFSQYGDDLREKRRARDAILTSASQTAATDIGDASVTPQLMQATERVSRFTGLDPQGVIDAIGDAQSQFSNLADAASRGSYLGTVLPMLGQAAVATNSSLTDMVGAAGEFQRQFHVSNADLPAAVARAIVEGRMGSIGFKDYAAHAGQLAGAATRTFSPDAANAPRTQALVGGLFQAAGQAGGGGGEAATRAQAFLNNLSSSRGQRALRSGVGYNPFTATGQLATREGETQVGAFARLAETAFARSHGNATRFLDTFAGHRDESRTLGDQLFRDLTAHGGRLTTFQEHANATLGATRESAIDAPFNYISHLPGPTRGREDVADFWRQSGDAANFADDTERQQREFARQHPYIARALDNPISGGFQYLTNDLYNEHAAATALPSARSLGADASRADLQARVALDVGQREARESGGSSDPALRQPQAEMFGIRELARLKLVDQARAEGRSVDISEESAARFAAANAAALLQALRGAQLTVAPAAPSSGTMPPTPAPH